MITIDRKKCKKCGLCAAVCPAIVISGGKGETAEYAHPDSCIKCWHCVAVCPAGAVSSQEFPLGDFKPIPASMTSPEAAVRSVIMGRRSIREFSKKLVLKEMIEEIIAEASNAPSGHNDRGVNLTVITDRDLIIKIDQRIYRNFETIGKIADNPISKTIVRAAGGEKASESVNSLIDNLGRYKNAEGDQRYMVFRGAPALVLAHTGLESLTGRDDCMIMMDQMMMAACARGLGATWIGILTGAAKIDPTLKKPLGVPAKHILHAAMILGWPKYKYKRYIPHKTTPVKWIV